MAVTNRHHVDNALVYDWCVKQFGDIDIEGRWYPLSYSFMFRDEADRDWFVLRWS